VRRLNDEEVEENGDWEMRKSDGEEIEEIGDWEAGSWNNRG